MTVLVPFACGYFLSYLYRNVNAVIAPDLIANLGIDASALGYLTAAFFLTFAACQIPIGLLLDRYGPRRVEATLLLFAAAGAVLFAFGDDLATLTIGRAVVGIGVSSCLMAAFKANALWWSAERLPLANSCFVAVGGLGAIMATRPVELALGFMTYSELFLLLAGLTLAASLTILLVVPERSSGASSGPFADQIGGVTQVLRSRVFWVVTPFTMAIHCSFIAYQGLWAGPWLRDVSGYGREIVADWLLLVAVSMTVGFIATGWIADRLRRMGVPPLTTMTAMSVALMLAEAGLAVQLPGTAGPLWMAFAFFGTASIITYAFLAQWFPVSLAGRVSTTLNFLVFSGAFGAQWGVGVIIDLYPPLVDGRYDPEGYRTGMMIAIGLQVAALAWLLANWRRVIRGRPA